MSLGSPLPHAPPFVRDVTPAVESILDAAPSVSPPLGSARSDAHHARARRPVMRVLWNGCWCCSPAPRNRLTSSELLLRRPWLPHSPSRWSRLRRLRRTVFLVLSNDRTSLLGYALLVLINSSILLSIFVMLVASLPQYRVPAMAPGDAATLEVLNRIETATVRGGARARALSRAAKASYQEPPRPIHSTSFFARDRKSVV